jgi:sigma-E factor negative regulatory protein RseB
MRFFIALFSLMLGASPAFAKTPVSIDWLKTMVFASHQTDYTGVFVYQYENHVETSRITHIADTDSEYEKLESLDGSKREIIRHHGQVWCFVNHKIVQSGTRPGGNTFPSLLPEQLSMLSENYVLRDTGVERVAGYNTQTILFQPKDGLRYAHRLWVHVDSGLLLKAAVLDEKGRVVEQYAFTQIQLGGINHAGLKNELVSLPAAPNTAQGVAVNSGWVVDALPAGFRKVTEIQRGMRRQHAPVIQIVFTDGLSALSLFIEPNDKDEDDIEGLSSRGALNLYQKLVGGSLITAVGDVPPRALIQVLESVRYNGK